MVFECWYDSLQKFYTKIYSAFLNHSEAGNLRYVALCVCYTSCALVCIEIAFEWYVVDQEFLSGTVLNRYNSFFQTNSAAHHWVHFLVLFDSVPVWQFRGYVFWDTYRQALSYKICKFNLNFFTLRCSSNGFWALTAIIFPNKDSIFFCLPPCNLRLILYYISTTQNFGEFCC